MGEEEDFQASYREYSSEKAASSGFSFKSFLPGTESKPLLPVSFQDIKLFSSKPDDWTETCGLSRFQVYCP